MESVVASAGSELLGVSGSGAHTVTATVSARVHGQRSVLRLKPSARRRSPDLHSRRDEGEHVAQGHGVEFVLIRQRSSP